MRQKIVVLWLYSTFFFCTLAFADIPTIAGNNDTFGYAWHRDWGGKGAEMGWDICSGDGYLYVVGSTQDIDIEDWDIYLIKYDTEGNLIWNRTWSTPEDDSAREVIVYDGYIYVTGGTYDYYPGTAGNLVLLKYDPQGNLIWDFIWNESCTGGIGLTALDNHIYVLERDFLVKFSTKGEMIWNRSFTDWGDRITNYGGFIYVTFMEYQNYSTMKLFKYNMNGDPIWNCSWSRSKTVQVADVMAYNGYIYLTGYNYKGNNESVVILLKYDEKGNMIWNLTYGERGVVDISQMVEYNGSLYLFGDAFKNTLERMSDAILMKFDTDGNFVWDRIFGGRYHEYGKCVTVCDGDIYGAGDRDVNENNRDTFIVKFEHGASGDGIIDDKPRIPTIFNIILIIVVLIVLILFIYGMIHFLERKKK